MTCKHEPHIPDGNIGEIKDWCVMNIGNVKIHLCTKCHLVYWEEL